MRNSSNFICRFSVLVICSRTFLFFRNVQPCFRCLIVVKNYFNKVSFWDWCSFYDFILPWSVLRNSCSFLFINVRSLDDFSTFCSFSFSFLTSVLFVYRLFINFLSSYLSVIRNGKMKEKYNLFILGRFHSYGNS